MKLAYLPPYGHAFCPQCTIQFDVFDAVPTILEKAPHNDTIIYIMCPECHAAYQAGDDAKRKSMANKCFMNFKLTGIGADGAIYPWAVTTWLTLELNDFDPVAAIENGNGLTREQYFGICAGTHEVVVFPGGVRIVMAKPARPEAV